MMQLDLRRNKKLFLVELVLFISLIMAQASANGEVDLSIDFGNCEVGKKEHKFSVEKGSITKWELKNDGGAWHWMAVRSTPGLFSGFVLPKSDASGEHAGKMGGEFVQEGPGSGTPGIWKATVTGRGNDGAGVSLHWAKQEHKRNSVCLIDSTVPFDAAYPDLIIAERIGNWRNIESGCFMLTNPNLTEGCDPKSNNDNWLPIHNPNKECTRICSVIYKTSDLKTVEDNLQLVFNKVLQSAKVEGKEFKVIAETDIRLVDATGGENAFTEECTCSGEFSWAIGREDDLKLVSSLASGISVGVKGGISSVAETSLTQNLIAKLQAEIENKTNLRFSKTMTVVSKISQSLKLTTGKKGVLQVIMPQVDYRIAFSYYPDDDDDGFADTTETIQEHLILSNVLQPSLRIKQVDFQELDFE